MARFDIETFTDALETYLKANLNTKITEINTTKGDSLLDQINNEAYIKQFLDSIPNYNPFIVIGVKDDITVVSIGPESIQNFSIDIIIFFTQIGAADDYKKAWRYQKALREVIQSGFNSVFRPLKIELSTLTPASVAIQNNSQMQRAVGVSILVPLT